MIQRLSLMSRLVLLSTLAAFAALTGLQLTAFGAPWGVTAAMDMRFTGYTAKDAAQFLEVIGAEGRAVFFGSYRMLDTIFPPLLAISLIILFRCMRSLRSGVWIAVFALLPMCYLAADLAENAFLKDLYDPALLEQAARYASKATILKYIALALSVAGIVIVAKRPYHSEV